jgi:hypothetical protein
VVKDEDAEELPTQCRRFTVLEISSGLAEDSREEDQRAEDRRLRELRIGVKKARAMAASTPGLDEILAKDWQKAARFYARFGISQEMFRHEVPAREDSSEANLWPDFAEPHVDVRTESRTRAESILPE